MLEPINQQSSIVMRIQLFKGRVKHSDYLDHVIDKLRTMKI